MGVRVVIFEENSILTIVPVLPVALTADHRNCTDNRMSADLTVLDVRGKFGTRCQTNDRTMLWMRLRPISVKRVVKKVSEEDEKNGRALIKANGFG